MLVLSNRRVGPAAELTVSRAIGHSVFRDVAAAARPIANALWERELVRWLDEQAARIAAGHGHEIRIDVGDIAFTPQHFEHQRRFLLDAITLAHVQSEYSRALSAWADLIEAHPRDSVQFGRRWLWHSTV